MAIDIKKYEVTEIRDCEGNLVEEGDEIILRNYRNEDVVCIFDGLRGGYFITKTTDGKHEIKYILKKVQEIRLLEKMYGAPKMYGVPKPQEAAAPEKTKKEEK